MTGIDQGKPRDWRNNYPTWPRGNCKDRASRCNRRDKESYIPPRASSTAFKRQLQLAVLFPFIIIIDARMSHIRHPRATLTILLLHTTFSTIISISNAMITTNYTFISIGSKITFIANPNSGLRIDVRVANAATAIVHGT